MKRLTAILLCTLAYGAATAADGWDAPPDQHVNALRRLPARATSYSVSYTHLTLPTILRV
mgnify:CR=1 FL=1